jgi:hypothetical protein
MQPLEQRLPALSPKGFCIHSNTCLAIAISPYQQFHAKFQTMGLTASLRIISIY